jgi:ATP:cob(I)alamin adenosyltransferase
MLYTRKGDNGTTKTFGCSGRVSKASLVAEALGASDEVNSFLGLLKVKAAEIKNNSSEKNASTFSILDTHFADITHWIQEGLFIVQAELAGAQQSVTEERVKKVEEYTDAVENILPLITTFFISGGTELAALCDISRTMIRNCERRVIAVCDAGEATVSDHTKAFLNRLSSLLYAMARLSNHLSGINEQPPSYK